MSEQNTADNWRLEDTGDTLDQWKLQETEQNQAEQWQLQRTRPDVGWQPVEYERQGARRGSWILPLLVGVALVAVFSYGVWIGLGTLGVTDIRSLVAPAQTEPTPTAAVAVAAESTTAAEPTLEPTVTATVAPTDTPPPTPSPTPEPLKVEQQIVRITNQYGVNARREPSTEGELVQVLQQGQEFLVTEERDGDWLQVALPSAELVWISSEFVEKRSELVPLDVANQRRTALNLPALAASTAVTATQSTAVAAVITPTVETLPLTATQPITEAVAVTGTTPGTTEPTTNTLALATPVAEPTSLAVSTEITGTVIITAGLNARSAPTTTAQAVILLNGGTVLTITGRSADSQWLQVRLADNTLAWVFAEFVEINPTSAPAPVATPGATTPVTTSVTTTTTGTTGTSPTASGISASVKSLSGANARLAPDRSAESAEVIAYDTVLAVRGRTANNEWLQVEYQGEQLWVLVSTVSVSADLASLPVVTP